MHRLGYALGCWLLVANLWAAPLQQITVLPTRQGLILEFGFSGKNVHQAFILHHPERVVVDFPHTALLLDSKTIHSPFIRNVRVGYPKPGVSRLVFEMTQPVASTHWQAKSLHITWLHFAAPLRAAAVSQPQTGYKRSPRVVIVIDPGHGGKDPGAIGLRQTREKNLVLGIARNLQAILNRQPGIHAVLTRDGDDYIGLRTRMRIARQHNADLFIAIHADAFGDHHSHGASIFALSQRGATSEAARWLAEKENYSELGGVNLAGLDDANGVIRSVLIDLSQTATIAASLRLGQYILSSLQSTTPLHSHKVEQARFMVLKSPDIPSLLIEVGFLSNQQEEIQLNTPLYQTQMCQRIAAGIKRYLWEYPPRGSRIAAQVSMRRAQK